MLARQIAEVGSKSEMGKVYNTTVFEYIHLINTPFSPAPFHPTDKKQTIIMFIHRMNLQKWRLWILLNLFYATNRNACFIQISKNILKHKGLDSKIKHESLEAQDCSAVEERFCSIEIIFLVLYVSNQDENCILCINNV